MIRICFFTLILCISCTHFGETKTKIPSCDTTITETNYIVSDSSQILTRILSDERVNNTFLINDSNEIECKIDEFMPDVWVVKIKNVNNDIHCDAVVEKFKHKYNLLDVVIYEK